MTTSPNLLKSSLLGMQDMPQQAAPTPKPPAPNAAAQIAPCRQGKRVISGYFDPAAAKQLKMLSVEADRSVQSLLQEAINDLFKKHGRSAVA